MSPDRMTGTETERTSRATLLRRIERLTGTQQEMLLSRLSALAEPGRDGASIKLVAYIAEKKYGTLSSAEIRHFVAQRIPHAVVPAEFIRVRSLPVLPSGKVDRNALPPPGAVPFEPGTPYAPPATPVEERLAALWSEVLGVPEPGVHDGFWASGGQSALAVRLVSRIRAEFGVELPVASLFDEPTIAGLARRVAAAPRQAPMAASDAAVLSSAQLRHWFLQALDPESSAYTICDAVRIAGPLDVAALERALGEIVRRHAVLRTRYPARQGRPVAEVMPSAGGLARDALDHVPHAKREQALLRLVRAQAHRPFDLTAEPPLRLRLVRMGDRDHALILVAHHIAADDVAFTTVYRELGLLYAAFSRGLPSPLPEPPITYGQYAAREARLIERDEEEALRYWTRELAPARDGRPLPTDLPRGPRRSGRAVVHRVRVPGRTAARLEAAARSHGTTMFTMALTAFARLLARRTGDDQVVIGVPFANRGHGDVEDLVGCFTNPAALRVDLSGGPGVDELVSRVHGAVARAHRYQHVPYEKVVDALRTAWGVTRPEPFAAVLNVITASEAPELPGCVTSRMDTSATITTKYDLTLYLQHAPGVLHGHLVCDADLFTERTAAALAGEFESLLGEAAAAQPAKEHAMNATPGDLPVMRRKAVVLDASDAVTMGPLAPDRPLPLVVTAARPVEPVSWAEAHREELGRRLLECGAILFRGFGVRTKEEFERFALVFVPELLHYVEGSSPRTALADGVYTSTEYPAGYTISLHNELSYAHTWPGKLFFFCQTAPSGGGETPIADCRRVLESLPDDLVAAFTRSGVQYVRNLRDGDGPGLSWREVFETADRTFVERYCAEGDIDFRWKDDGGLWTRQVRPAVIRHPRTGERVWFNQADQWHPSGLGEELATAMSSVAGEAGLPINARYGDGSPIDPADLDVVRKTAWQAAVRFAWEEGDILMIDNMLVSHGRMPFTGPRRVLVAMGETVRLGDVAS